MSHFLGVFQYENSSFFSAYFLAISCEGFDGDFSFEGDEELILIKGVLLTCEAYRRLEFCHGCFFECYWGFLNDGRNSKCCWYLFLKGSERQHLQPFPPKCCSINISSLFPLRAAASISLAFFSQGLTTSILG